ncbi:MAG: hypothetical protein AB7E55_32565, partial [Pigmentiphaga sp.]
IPMHYVVTTPVFAKASSAAEAIGAAQKVIDGRNASKLAAQAMTAKLGLPKLTGTPRQIEWATRLRANFAQANPEHPTLRRATTAKYWIDNHR